MVNPNWNTNDNTTAAAADEMPSSSELPSKQQSDSDTKSSEQPPTVASSSLPPSTITSNNTTTTKPKKTMAQSILDLLAAHNSSSPNTQTTTSNTTTTHSLPTKNNISEAELKRRHEIELSIRLKSKQIIQENERLSKLKPLEFSKPTFRYTQGGQQGQEGKEGNSSTSRSSSLSSLGKKRKASSITNTTSLSPLRCYTGTSTNPTAIPNNNCFQLQQLGSNRNHSGIYATSSAALPPPSKPYTNPYEATTNSSSMGGYFLPYGNNRQYTQEEVRGLVDFAHEWITPDSMKRRRI